MRNALILSALAFLTTTGATQVTPRVDRVEVWGKGVYEPIKKSENGSSRRLIKKGSSVPAKLGLRFGYRFRVVGEPAGALITLKGVAIYPEPGYRDPKTGSIHRSEDETLKVRIGEERSNLYTLDEEAELLPGTWTVELWYEGKRVSVQRFTLVKADR